MSPVRVPHGGRRQPTLTALLFLKLALVPFAVFWTAALVSAQRGWWAGLLFTVPAAAYGALAPEWARFRELSEEEAREVATTRAFLREIAAEG